MKQSADYDYAAGSQPGPLLRSYSNTYLTSSNYTSRYMFNRLQSSSVSIGSTNATLVSNGYDQSSLTDIINPVPREHDATYNTSLVYRGNATTQSLPDKTITRTFDIAGKCQDRQ